MPDRIGPERADRVLLDAIALVRRSLRDRLAARLAECRRLARLRRGRARARSLRFKTLEDDGAGLQAADPLEDEVGLLAREVAFRRLLELREELLVLLLRLDLLVAERAEPADIIVADFVDDGHVGMALPVPDVRVAVAVELAEDVAIAHRRELLAAVIRILWVVVPAVDEVPLGLPVAGLALNLPEVVAAAVADRGRDDVLMRPPEAADIAGAVRAAPDVDLARIDRIRRLRPFDHPQGQRPIDVELPAASLGFSRDDAELLLELQPLEAFHRAAEVVVLVPVHAVVDEQEREGPRGRVGPRRVHDDAHDRALLVLEFARELTGSALLASALLVLSGERGCKQEEKADGHEPHRSLPTKSDLPTKRSRRAIYCFFSFRKYSKKSATASLASGVILCSGRLCIPTRLENPSNLFTATE